jgi:hypothetical protein
MQINSGRACDAEIIRKILVVHQTADCHKRRLDILINKVIKYGI